MSLNSGVFFHLAEMFDGVALRSGTGLAAPSFLVPFRESNDRGHSDATAGAYLVRQVMPFPGRVSLVM